MGACLWFEKYDGIQDFLGCLSSQHEVFFGAKTFSKDQDARAVDISQVDKTDRIPSRAAAPGDCDWE